MTKLDGTQVLSNVVPASTIPLAIPCLGKVEAESPQALSSAQSVPTFKIFIDAFKSL